MDDSKTFTLKITTLPSGYKVEIFIDEALISSQEVEEFPTLLIGPEKIMDLYDMATTEDLDNKKPN